MKTNHPNGEWHDTVSDPRSGLPESPEGRLGAGGIPVPTPLLPLTGADHAQRLVDATLAGGTLPGLSPADARELYLSHAPNWAGVDPGMPFSNTPYQPAIPQQASDVTGTSRPDRNR